MSNIRSFQDLEVYEAAMDGAMEIFEATKEVPKAETYSMVGQIRRFSRSVCANLGEAWRRRRSIDSFRSNLSDAESEAAEIRVWLEFAYRCESLDADVARDLDHQYDQLVGKLVHMIVNAEDWTIRE